MNVPDPISPPIVLIVDGSRTNRNILAHLLEQEYQIKVAANGLRALEIAERVPQPDLILMCVMMPEMDGYAVCERLKNNPTTLDIPIIFVTAASDHDAESRGLSLGAADYLTKPINPDIALLRIRNQLLLKRSLSKLRLTAKVFDNALEGITITDANSKIIDVNPAFTRITGYSREEVLGNRPNILSSGDLNRAFHQELGQTLSDTGHWSGEVLEQHKSGELIPEWLSITAVSNNLGIVTHYVTVFTDISPLKDHETRLLRLAHYDALTNIPNRTLLQDRMQQAIAQSRRDQSLLAICYLDLDGFKQVNDHFGHQTGDQVLIEIAQRIGQKIREGDTAARLGGDEFSVLLGRLESVEECMGAIERLLIAIAQPITIQEQEFKVTASIGTTIFPLDDDDPDALLRHADQAMYQAKQLGKNRCRLFDPSHHHPTRARQESIDRIRQALKCGEFELYYQPKVELDSKKVVGAEALIRWHHPVRGLLMPGEFLPALEGTPLGVEIGEWVADSAIAQLEQWHSEGVELEVSINITISHLQSQGFAEHLRQRLAAHSELPQLQIEIVEPATMKGFSDISATIESCQTFGVSFALDDFGTGGSSFAYLRNLLAADTLKIDQSFVRNMLENESDRVIVQGVITLAQRFGSKTVIAEGVESMEHFQALLAMGCELAQGYCIARPMRAEKLVDWMKEWPNLPAEPKE